MAVRLEGQQTARALSPLNVVVLALGGLVLLPAAAAMLGSPWAGNFAAWALTAALACGFALGTLFVLLPLHRRWWLVAPGTAIFLGAAAAVGVALPVRAGVAGSYALGAMLLGGYAALLGASTPWIVLRSRQPWLAVAAVWITVAAAWGTKLSVQQVWWLVVLLALSVVLLGLAHLAAEKALWDKGNLPRLGPVLWPAARTVTGLSLLIGLVGLLPLGIGQLQALSALWSRTPAGHSGPLTYRSPRGTPVAMLGAPLSLAAPDTSGNQIILAYSVLEGAIVTPPLLGTTLDTFDGTRWTQSPAATSAALHASDQLPLPQGAQSLKVRVTVYAQPQSDTGSYLLGFDQPLAFSVPSQVRLLTGDAPSAVTIASWESAQPLGKGATYTTSSAILPDNVTGTGKLPEDVQQRMTELPHPLDASVVAQAQRWAGPPSTNVARAEALLDGLVHAVAYDPQASPPAGFDPVMWTLGHRRANALTLTTVYILLGRSLGLPLRLAEGYLPGTYDPALKQTVVRASDAAVWAQLAIPGVGWYDLYPAGTDITITVPGSIIYRGAPTPTPAPKQPAPNPQHQQSARRAPAQAGILVLGGNSWLAAALALCAVLLLLTAVVAFIQWRWARVGAHLAPLGQFFARVVLLARLGGIALRPSDTASQATGKVAAAVPPHREVLVTLNGAYERARYGPPGERGVLVNLRAHWNQVRGALWRLVLTRPWRKTGTTPRTERRKDGR